MCVAGAGAGAGAGVGAGADLDLKYPLCLLPRISAPLPSTGLAENLG